MKPKISVIIPCYNSEKTIDRCIKSLINQTIGLNNLQVIFVNDASTDSTIDILLKYEKEYSESILVIDLPENCRQGGARNVGIRYSQADYIGFVDSDDWIESDMYEKLYDKIKEYDCDAVTCRYTIDYEDGSVEDVFEEKSDSLIKINNIAEKKNLILNGISSGIWSKIYKKSIIIENDIYFPEKLAYEDNLWLPIYTLYTNSVYYLEEKLYHYCVHENSTTTSINAKHHFDRLTIELLKLEEYKKRGFFEQFFEEIEWNFIQLFYANTLNIFINKFTVSPINAIFFIIEKVKANFPNYKENKYYKTNPDIILKRFIDMIDKNYNESEWNSIIKTLRE